MKENINYFLYSFRAIFLIPKLRLGKYLILPFIMTLLLSFFIIMGLYFLMDFILKSFLGNYLLQYDYLIPALNILIVIQLIFFFGIFYRIVAQLLILPFLDPLRKELEKKYHITRHKETTFKEDVKNFFWGFYRSIVYVLIYIILMMGTFFLGPLQSFLLFIYDSYILGKGIFDVFLEKEFPEPKEREKVLKTQKIPILMTGIASMLILFIPILGILLSAICGYISVFLNYHHIKS